MNPSSVAVLSSILLFSLVSAEPMLGFGSLISKAIDIAGSVVEYDKKYIDIEAGDGPIKEALDGVIGFAKTAFLQKSASEVSANLEDLRSALKKLRSGDLAQAKMSFIQPFKSIDSHMKKNLLHLFKNLAKGVENHAGSK